MNDDLFLHILSTLYIDRKKDGIKSDFGRTLLLGGSRQYPGAILIAASLAEVSGCGYIALSVPESIRNIVHARMPLTFVTPDFKGQEDGFSLHQDPEKLLPYSSILFGNGIADRKENESFLEELLTFSHGFLVLDATALTLLARNPEVLKKKNAELKVLLTPHLGEASRLFKIDSRGKEPECYLEEAKAFSERYDVAILLKSSRSLLVHEGKVFLGDQIPTPSLGKAGSGDGLAGYLAGILSYATKDFSFEEAVLFSDSMVHKAARREQEKLSAGIASILDVPQGIREIVMEVLAKRK